MKLPYRWRATLVIALGLLMAVLDSTIVSVVLPQIATAFKTSMGTITWVATGYILANAAIIPVVGYISDRIGTKTVFLIALALFTIGSALCAFAPNEHMLIAFRVLQGIGGGALMPVATAIIFRLFGPTERAGAMSLLMIPLLLGPAFGPVLGGYLATNLSWNVIFTINLPIGVIAFLLALLILRGKAGEQEERDAGEPVAKGFDVFGFLFSMGAIVTLVYGISMAGANGWNDRTVLTYLIAGGALLITFLIVELRVADPVIDIRLFRRYTFTMANILIWVTTAVLYGSIFLLPFFFENVEGLSSVTTGEILISQGLAMVVSIALSGKLYNLIGPRILAVVGVAIVAVSMIGFTHLTITTTGADVQIWLILRGLGMGLVSMPLQTVGVSVISNKQMAKATSLMSSTQTVFSAIGLAVLTTYLTQHAAAHAQDGAATCIAQLGSHAQALHTCIAQQALTMGMNDTFLFTLICCLGSAVLAIFLGRDRALEAARAARQLEKQDEVKAPASIGD
ncbi:DHA2 family efflux MFS transporter permease subunit [Ktedonobacter racemifer]|uniref:Drug resistance transporter, EmrB/QacA subfamily n=1 Tax=Ktedonobacter racemifer DSM 44963 TaxID=485913 RepID=D6TWV3_KTERA|nr:DHA2 family efflux MFS transporter permease subunit [Ktedonobacter racemifer]EFH84686.1 drug resistance transporter, EmrB/QacA subfamily [Ktedonobacter racemifer DSM 44963]